MYVFNRYYQNFMYGFEKADDVFNRMTETQRTLYYEAVTNWVNSDAYEVEDKGIINKYYAELATRAEGDDLLTAYRLALLLLKNQDIRLRQKAEEYRVLQATRKTYSNLK